MEFLVAEWICSTCGRHQITWRGLTFCICGMSGCAGHLVLLQGIGFKSQTEIGKLQSRVIKNKTSMPTIINEEDRDDE